MGLLNSSFVEKTFELRDAEASVFQLVGVFLHGTETGDKVVVVAFHDTYVTGEQVNPGVVRMQTNPPVHLEKKKMGK